MVPKWLSFMSPMSLSTVVRSLSQPILNLVFPPSCVACQRPGALICDRCAQAVNPVQPPFCARCGRAQTQPVACCERCAQEAHQVLQIVRAAAFYVDPLPELIQQFKYGKRPELAQPLARYLLSAFDSPVWRRVGRLDLVVPVPMFEERRKERGYNQAELLATEFGRLTRQRVLPAALQRIRFTQPQVGLDFKQRQENVADAFIATAQVAGKRLLLIDDVYTTGATLRACASAALEAGAVQVYGLALAIPVI